VLDVLRPGVLSGVSLCVAGGGDAVRARAAGLGAAVVALTADLDDEDAVAADAGALGRVDVLVVDAATPFAVAGGGMTGLRRAVDGGWNAVRAVANAGWVTADAPGGKVVFLAPGAAAGEHAEAVGAALENAARTLSIEWARFGVRTTAILPRAGANDAEIAELVAFLASPAGDYFTGCAFAPGTYGPSAPSLSTPAGGRSAAPL
jgi:NAD(P)-dependent dehydrogenase (short-subunit alcohol dehydrogenase family)